MVPHISSLPLLFLKCFSDEQRKRSVVGCRREHKNLHALPETEELKTKWITFAVDDLLHNYGKILSVSTLAKVAKGTISIDGTEKLRDTETSWRLEDRML